jgi:acetyltransferase-like isoleucine patch superfamily enzyme
MCELLRDALVFIAVIITAPLWCGAVLEARLGKGDDFFATCTQWLSLFPGKLGIYLRRGFYRQTLDRCATDCSIGFGTTLAHRQVQIGRGVYIGIRCTLGSVAIDDDVTIGSNVDILSGRRQHGFAELHLPIQKQQKQFSQIRIGRNSWIGNSSVVMADIGADCIIGAGSVVVASIPARSIAVGNPCSVKRERDVEPAHEQEGLNRR